MTKDEQIAALTAERDLARLAGKWLGDGWIEGERDAAIADAERCRNRADTLQLQVEQLTRERDELRSALAAVPPAQADDAAEIMLDRQYLAGLQQGWTLGQVGDTEAFRAAIEARGRDIRAAMRGSGEAR